MGVVFEDKVIEEHNGTIQFNTQLFKHRDSIYSFHNCRLVYFQANIPKKSVEFLKCFRDENNVLSMCDYSCTQNFNLNKLLPPGLPYIIEIQAHNIKQLGNFIPKFLVRPCILIKM